MRILWLTVTAGLGTFFMKAPAHLPFFPVQAGVEAGRQNDTDEWINRGIERDAARRGLWYGTPGVRPGDDMLGPILNLIKQPSGLFDFRPRRSLSERDLEVIEFNRRFRMSEHGSDPWDR